MSEILSCLFSYDRLLSPNRKDVRNPRGEFMLKELEDMVQGKIPLPDGGFVSGLTVRIRSPRYRRPYQAITPESRPINFLTQPVTTAT
jgi:hypothetical protein